MKWLVLAVLSLLPGHLTMVRLDCRFYAAAGLLAALACSPQPPAGEKPPAEAVSASSLEGREWSLVNLGERPAPPGAGGRPATIQFDAGAGRASGFAGCNRYSGSYTVAGDSLTFGPAVSTKMACADGDELERSYLAVLPEVRSYQVSDSVLTLKGPSGLLARFRAP